jgi:hypothetical protein
MAVIASDAIAAISAVIRLRITGNQFGSTADVANVKYTKKSANMFHGVSPK